MHWNFTVALVPRGETAETTDEIRTVETTLSKPLHNIRGTGTPIESKVDKAWEAALNSGIDEYALKNHWDLYCGHATLDGLDRESVKETVNSEDDPSIHIPKQVEKSPTIRIECETKERATELETTLHETYGDALSTQLFTPDNYLEVDYGVRIETDMRCLYEANDIFEIRRLKSRGHL